MKRIKFTKLFGRFNYDIEFKDEGITIITGPNGFGKSTILRCIDSIQNGIAGIGYWISLDFEKIEFFYEDDVIEIKKDSEKLYIDKSSFNIEDVYKKILRLSYRYIPYLRHINEKELLDRRNGKSYEIKDLLANRDILNDLLDNEIPLSEIFPQTVIKKFKKLSEITGNIFFIKEQRLISNNRENHRQDDRVINIIEQLPEKLKRQIGEISEKYSKVANEYDSTYLYRLFNEKRTLNEIEFSNNMKEMKRKLKKLKEYDISEINSNRKIEFKQEFSTALKVFFEDFNNKYKVYEDLITKFDLYIGIINSRLNFKKIKISREEGIEIFSDTGKKLKLLDLSSGEQQEIVLFYKLIFETPNKSLLLIDEPEISLHIVWQKIFMDDLQKVVNLKNLNVIVATHSAQIINNHWEKQIDLGEIYGN